MAVACDDGLKWFVIFFNSPASGAILVEILLMGAGEFCC